MFQPDEDGVYARVEASASRRIMACCVVFGLGVLVLYLAFSGGASLGARTAMILFGIGALVLGERLRRATQGAVILTDAALVDQTGALIANLDELKSVERGAFAMKPSNGFVLSMETQQPRAWAPGLWWRLGRRVGVGGVTSAGASKFMAEQIALRLATRED